MPRRAAWLILPLLLLHFSPCSGAELRTVEVGLFGGAFLADGSVGVDDDFVYGARLGYSFTPMNQAELVLDRVDTTFRGVEKIDEADEQFTTASAHWVVNFPSDRGVFLPYFLFGLGWVEDEIDLPGGATSSDDDFMLPWGGGFRAFFGDNFALRVEFRGKAFETFDVSQDHFEISLGLTWTLGSRR